MSNAAPISGRGRRRVEQLGERLARQADAGGGLVERPLGLDLDVDRELDGQRGGGGVRADAVRGRRFERHVNELAQLAWALRLKAERERRRLEADRLVLADGDKRQVGAWCFYGSTIESCPDAVPEWPTTDPKAAEWKSSVTGCSAAIASGASLSA